MNTENIIKEIEKYINPFLVKLKKQPYVIGVVLLGGLGERSFLDSYSDIDLAVFISKKDKKKIFLPFEFHYKIKDKVLEFNIHQNILEYEEKSKDWEDFKKEAYSRGKIIYDPTGRISKLIKKKIVFNKDKAFNRLVWIVQQYRWRGQIHSIRSYRRGFPEASHHLLNECTEMLLEAVYLLNKEYLPHKKWSLVYLKDMKGPFNKLHFKFKEAMLIKNYEISDIKRRIRILDNIYNLILKEIIKKYKDFPKNPYKYYYTNFIQLNKVTKIDRALKIFEKKLTGEELEIIQGFMCFNIVNSMENLLKVLSQDNNIGNIQKIKIRSILESKNVIRKNIKNENWKS